MLTVPHAILFAVCTLGISAEEKQPLDAAKLVGKWTTVKLEGKDIGDFIVGIDAEFGKDGNFSMTAKVKQGGRVVSLTKTGTYKVEDGALVMTVDKATRRSKGWFQGERLILPDPSLDSRVYYERVKSKKAN